MPLTQSGKTDIRPATGKLGILLPGMGAVATTFMAGVEAIRRGISKPIGSLTQMGTIRLGKRTDNRSPAIKDFVPLAKLDDLVFGGWDLFPDNAYEAAVKAGVLSKEHLDSVKEFLTGIKPMTAVFEQAYVKKLTATHAKKGKSKLDLAEQVIDDIKAFKKQNNCDRLVDGLVWLDRGLSQAGPGPRDAGRLREGAGRERPRDRAVADLRVRGAEAGRPLRQRRAQPDRRHAGADGAGARRTTCRSAARTSRPARP